MERISILESIEKDIFTILQSAGQALMELSKEKSSLKQAEGHTHQFLKSLSTVESKLSDQINYLTQVSTGKVFLRNRIFEVLLQFCSLITKIYYFILLSM